jgi:hypothetical protein
LDELTGEQINEWEAYDRIDPIGTWTEYFRMACLESIITNLAIGIHGKEGTKLTSPMDFMPDWAKGEEKQEIKQQSVESMKELLMGIAEIQNKKFDNIIKKPKKG